MSRAVSRLAAPILSFIRIFTSRMTLAVRILVLTTGSVALILAAVGGTIYFTVEREFQRSVDDAIIRRAQAGVEANLSNYFAGGVDPALLALSDIKVTVLRSGQQMALTTGAPENNLFPSQFISYDEIAVSLGKSVMSVRTARTDQGVPYRIVAVQSAPGEALVMAQSLAPTERALDRLRFILYFTAVVGTAVAGLAGWAVATNGLRPVRRLTAATGRVARTQELTPIPVTGSDDLARLSTSFNQMLAALEESRTQQKQLIADAGHELRTPLTSLRTNVELMSQASADGRRLSDEQRREIMGDVRAQLEELTTLVGDLVELARDEPVERAPESLDLAEVAEVALDRVQRRGPTVTFEAHLEPWPVVGEPQLLERAVTNLLDNAAKWSPAGGTVRMTLVDGVVTVTDEGPGIAEADLPHVFERFYRATESRTMPGSGLGLSIVQRAADRHGGSVEVTSTLGEGATFRLMIPSGTES